MFLLPFFLSGYNLLRDPHHNKGLAFNEKERDAHYLRGLLPPVVVSQKLQVCIHLTLVETSIHYAVICIYVHVMLASVS